MMWLIIALTIAVWFSTIIFAFLAGRFSVRQEIEEAQATRAFAGVSEGPPGPQGVAGNPGPQGIPGEDGKTPDANDLLMYNGDTLNSWAESMYERLKRVERKSGLRV